MSTGVYLRLKDGRRVRFGKARDLDAAVRVKREVEGWLRQAMILSVGNHLGVVEEITPTRVVAVELLDEPSPYTGNREVGGESRP